MPAVVEKEKVATTVDTTPEPLTLDKVKALIADALKQNHTADHPPTTAVKPPQSTAHPDTRATSAKKSTLNWQTAGVIVLMVSAIIGGWWTLENRFEKKLEGEIQQVRQEIKEVRQEVQESRQEINTRIDAIYQLLLEQRR